MESWREECGLMGAWEHEEAARLTYLGLYAIQHRGQESSGIVSLQDGLHYHHKGLGLVADVFGESELNSLKGRSALGHVRYSTTGMNLLSNAQPLLANLYYGPIAIAHNGNIVNASQLKKELQLQGAIFQGTNDTEVLLHLISRFPSSNIITCISECVKRLVGAYSLLILTHDKLVAVRDPFGFRPLVVGKKKNDSGLDSYLFASETCAFDLVGAELVREVEPGEIFWVDEKGPHSLRFAPSSHKKAQCIFEHVYFSRPDSIVFGKSVYASRKEFGRWLAKETHVESDLVVPVPDSGVPAAIGYSQESGVPFELGIIRNHYVGRTFIQPHPSVRSLGVRIKLNPQSEILKNKRIVVVDDSLVRGTTSQKIIRLVRQAGAKEVHMRIASPPTIAPCFYGVDTPKREHLIASHQSLEEIRSFIGADTLAYLSMEGLYASILAEDHFCAACFNRKYPTPI